MDNEKILIVDDSKLNRTLLTRLLSDEYEIIQAENGRKAMELLQEQNILCVILDLIMPVMDGIAFLREFHENPEFHNIPVLVATSDAQKARERECLELGAWDFISKPYDASILRMRLKNIIGRSKAGMLAQLRHVAEHDALTGLYNRARFFVSTRELLDRNPTQEFAMIRFDVDHFRLFNSFFGDAEGDRLLRCISENLEKEMQSIEKCTYGRIDSDVFAMCIPNEPAQVDTIVRHGVQMLNSYNTSYYMEPSFGICIITNPALPVQTIYAHAAIAARYSKDQVQKHVSYYDESMSEREIQEQSLMNEAQSALDARQFVVYLQPKYNLKTGRPYGAEALSRWNHPQKGLIQPGRYIPTFERNGFIGKLDYYMWESTCQLLRKWLDAGLHPAPISVNVSRANLYNPRLAEILRELVKKYAVPPELLNLELTESTYMGSPELMKKVVSELQCEGFLIMMDDFGSGFSSLNVLKDIAVDVLKIDMKFIPTGENNARGERILASVIRMAEWLQLPVVMEGVETKEQMEFLRGIGCDYVQGYYFARPMPVADYEALLRNLAERQMPAQANCPSDAAMMRAAWLSTPETAQLLAGIDQPVAVFAYSQQTLTPVRCNQAFDQLFGQERNAAGTADSYGKNVPAENLQLICATAERAIKQHSRAECEYFRIDRSGRGKWIRVIFHCAQGDQSGALLVASFTDITKQKNLELELEKFDHFIEQPMRKKLLIVDDSEVSRAILKSIFEREFQVIEAENGADGLDKLQMHQAEIGMILLDMMMPGIDGIGFLTRKNADPAYANIPVVVISAEQRSAIQRNMLKLGVNDYITKPYIPELVRRRVQNVLDYDSRFRALVQEYRRSAQ
ncbi:MAG: EAL domain-containing protein [Oscillospiraceae bacterium]|nr:EAL domain-containing protein [Oscillospiraceae bacterium]